MKVQSVAMFMVHIYYPIEAIFLASVCLAYLPLFTWELFRKKYLWSKKEMKLHILIIVMRTNVKVKNAMILLLFSLLVTL